MSRCRLCGGALTDRFGRQVLGKYPVRYLQCAECGSLQTETPYWLDEAYAHNLSNLDTGAAQRNLTSLAVCWAVCRLFGLANVIDFGGGDGLLCRLMRDYRINCFVTDKYARPTYAQGFTTPDFARPDLVVACEVVEHLANPATELDALFAAGPPVVLVGTYLYAANGENWWYLAPESGQHVFFYSREAIGRIGARYGYRPVVGDGYVVFARAAMVSPIKAGALRLLMHPVVRRLLRAVLLLLPAPGAVADHERLRSPDDRRRLASPP